MILKFFIAGASRVDFYNFLTEKDFKTVLFPLPEHDFLRRYLNHALNS